MTHAKPKRLLCEIAFELAVIGVIGNPRDRVNEWRTNDSATRHLPGGVPMLYDAALSAEWLSG